MKKSPASSPQPHPVRGGTQVLNFVLMDLLERAEKGKEKYGHYLEVENDRDPLWDAYQEAIDLVMYLRQELLKRENT